MRTSQQIQAEVDAVQDQYPELKALTSTSQVGFFRLLKNMWITLVMAVEQRVDDAIAAVTQAVADNRVGSLAWYVKTIKAFQYGDSVSVYDGYRVGYATINPDKQVVAQAAVTEGADGRLLVKVAKNNPTLWPYQRLSESELTALKEYVRQVKYAGVAVDVISLNADEMRIEAIIQYDRQVLDASGVLLSDPAHLPVLEAIYNYARKLPFDGVFSWTGLTDACQAVNGVVDFQVIRTLIRPAGSTAWTEFSRQTSSRAGHINVIEPAVNYV